MGESRSRARSAVVALAGVVVVLAGGCAHYQSQPVDVAASMEALEARSLDDARLREYLVQHLGRSAPWDLPALTLAAWYFSPEMDVARAAHGVTQAAVVTAGQRPVPTLSVPFQYATNPKAGDSPYTLGLGVDIPIETAGKRGYRVAQATRLSVAARLEVGATAWRVRTRLREQLLAWWSDRRVAALLDEQARDRVALEQMIEHRVAVGAASALDLDQARANLAQDRRRWLDAQRQSEDALAAAAGVIGIPAAALRRVPLALDAFASPPPQPASPKVREAALRDRADVQAALAKYEASQAALQLAMARQYPDIHIGPGYTFDAGEHKFGFSLIGLPIALPRDNRGPIAEALARRKEAAVKVEQSVAGALSEADRALAGLTQARAALAQTDAQLAARQRMAAGARKSFALGEQDRVDLVTARLQERSAALDREDALAQLQRAAGALENAIQRPADSGLPPVEQPQ